MIDVPFTREREDRVYGISDHAQKRTRPNLAKASSPHQTKTPAQTSRDLAWGVLPTGEREADRISFVNLFERMVAWFASRESCSQHFCIIVYTIVIWPNNFINMDPAIASSLMPIAFVPYVPPRRFRS